jgi:hypothetical protein
MDAQNVEDTSEHIVLFICFGVFCLVVLAINLLFLRTLNRTLKEVAPENRDLKPGRVWLLLIPVFNFVWLLIVIRKIASSLRKEFRARKMAYRSESYGANVGMIWFCSLAAELLVFCLLLPSEDERSMECCTAPIRILGIFSWIVYWNTIAKYGKRLRNHDQYSSIANDQPSTDGRNDFDFDDD